MTRKRVLIVFEEGLYVRNFLQSGALDELRERFECKAVLGANVDPTPVQEKFVVAGTVKPSALRISLSRFRMYLTMWAYRSRSTSFPLKFEADIGRRKYRHLCRLFGLPFLAPISGRVLNLLMGTDVNVDAILDREKPDMVVIPSFGTDLYTTDFIAACRKRKILTFNIINGWDNLSTKGVMLQHPDYLGVWGEESKEHAIRIQRYPASRIFILGVPHFETYRFPPAEKEVLRIRQIHAVPEGAKILLFSGCARDVAELPMLAQLDQAIDRGDLPGFHIIYRPHPWGHAVDLEKKLKAGNCRHISLDAQIAETYRTLLTEGKRRNSSNFMPDLAYYPALIESSSCVISPLSTFLIEAAVMGKPALAVAFSPEKVPFPLERIVQCEHFKYLSYTRGVLTCRDAGAFLGDVKKLVALSEDPDIRRVLKQDIENIVFQDEHPYGGHLVDAIQRIFGGGKPEIIPARAEPVQA